MTRTENQQGNLFSLGVVSNLTILKEESLVHDRKVGREARYKLHASPLKEVEGGVAFYRKYWNNNMMRLSAVN